MKKKSWQRHSAGRKAGFLLLLSIGLIMSSFSFPVSLAATGTPVLAVKTTAPPLDMQTAPAPVTLKDFVKLNIDKLAAEATFKNWKGAQSQYYPLGPGTHSWLVNVMNGVQRIGYMIISSNNEGGYVLSEYGAGYEGLPYSLSELRQFLVQEGLISSSFTETLALTPLYSPVLPLWEVTISGTKLYITAATPEILPWNSSRAEAILKQAATAESLNSIDVSSNRSPKKIFRTKETSDPFENMLWLTNPKLPLMSDEVFSAVIKEKGNLVFQSVGQNDTVGGPLMITGYQIWRSNIETAELGTSHVNRLYAAVGPQGKRFIPLSLLQKYGTLQQAEFIQ